MRKQNNPNQSFGRSLAQGAVSSEQNRQAARQTATAERRERYKARVQQARSTMAERGATYQAGQQQRKDDRQAAMADRQAAWQAKKQQRQGMQQPQAPSAGLVNSAMQGGGAQEQPFNPFN